MLVLLSLLAQDAPAVDWESSRLGQFYEMSRVEESELRQAGEAVVSFGNATGFIVSPQGHVLTNHHVYETFGTSGTITRQWLGQDRPERYRVELVARSSDYDVAVYRVTDDTDALPYLPIRTTTPVVGERVAVIGHPHGWTQRASYGRVLADDLVIGGNPSVEYSAQTWWGSSGSPVIDEDGYALAIHWGWDSSGKSHGRLTGIPFDQMVENVAEVDRIARHWGAQAEPAFACTADDYSVRSELVQRGVATNRQGRRLDHVDVSLTSSDRYCADLVSSVVWELHPTFRDPVIDGNAARMGHPVELNTWGFFPTTARVRLQSGELVSVGGYVQWER